MGTTLTISRGDSRTFTIPATLDGVSYNLGDVAVAIFTAKNDARDLDSAAAIQKASGLGLSTSGSNFTLSLVPADTDSFFDGKSLAWDIQGQLSDGNVLTLASGMLRIVGDITRETTTSVPVYTSQPPIPGHLQLADLPPSALGEAAVGGSQRAARADHVHPMPSAAAIGADPAGSAAAAQSAAAGALAAHIANAAVHPPAVSRSEAETGSESSLRAFSPEMVFVAARAAHVATASAAIDIVVSAYATAQVAVPQNAARKGILIEVLNGADAEEVFVSFGAVATIGGGHRVSRLSPLAINGPSCPTGYVSVIGELVGQKVTIIEST